jgi:hypothetical protein
MNRDHRPTAERCLARAAECTAIAMKATDSRIKAFSMAEADTWLRLAAKIVEKPDERADNPPAGDSGV